ncbi:MAG: hypothetical protein Q7L07_01690 [Pseudohongiella sp.]|nr:hypothetical protein [Pseudohongiella sp.]
MSRDVQHLVRELPEGVTLRLTEPPFGQEIPFMPDMDADGKSRSTSTVPETNSLTDIEAKLKQVRMEFIATLGEAETYKALLTDHPGLRNQLEPLYHLSRDQSSNLMGQLRALEQTLKLLEEQ